MLSSARRRPRKRAGFSHQSSGLGEKVGFGRLDAGHRGPHAPQLHQARRLQVVRRATNFQLPGQLVGVVGSGCGKSNIMDAVRWVLGENKASELRGESCRT